MDWTLLRFALSDDSAGKKLSNSRQYRWGANQCANIWQSRESHNKLKSNKIPGLEEKMGLNISEKS